MSKPRVKMCGFTRIEDVRFALSLDVDALGFVFYKKSPRYVSIAQAKLLLAPIGAFCSRVALFVNESASEVQAHLNELEFDLLQFHGDETGEYCRQFKHPYIKAIRMQENLNWTDIFSEYHDARGLLLDAFVADIPGGTGRVFDWTLVPQDSPLPIILSGGLNAQNVRQAWQQVQPWALDVSSGIEESAACKSATKMTEFLNALA